MTSLASYWLGRLRARALRLVTLRVAFALMTVATSLSGVAALASIRALDAVKDERAAAAERSCLAGDDTRALIRRMSRDAPLEVGEALIEVASSDGGEPPDPAVIDAFREAMKRRLEGIVNQLPARRWDPAVGECVDVALDTGG